LTLTDASEPAVVGVLTVGGFGIEGVVIVGTVTAGAAPADSTDALNHPHASAQTGNAITTKMRRSQVRRVFPIVRGPNGSRERFGTKTLPGS